MQFFSNVRLALCAGLLATMLGNASVFAMSGEQHLLLLLPGVYLRDDSRTNRESQSYCPETLRIWLDKGPLLRLTEAVSGKHFFAFAEIGKPAQVTHVPGGIFGGDKFTIKRETILGDQTIAHRKIAGSFVLGIPVSATDKVVYKLSRNGSGDVLFTKSGTDFDREDDDGKSYRCVFTRRL